jgi:hypothetical protein
MSASPFAPLVRRVLLCRKVEVTNAGLPEEEYVIRGVLNTVRSLSGVPFPFLARGLWMFVQFSDGQGVHSIKLRVFREDDGALVRDFTLPPVRMTIERLALLSRAYKLPEIPFRTPGVYEFRVVCGESVAADTIRVERSS